MKPKTASIFYRLKECWIWTSVQPRCPLRRSYHMRVCGKMSTWLFLNLWKFEVRNRKQRKWLSKGLNRRRRWKPRLTRLKPKLANLKPHQRRRLKLAKSSPSHGPQSQQPPAPFRPPLTSRETLCKTCQNSNATKNAKPHKNSQNRSETVASWNTSSLPKPYSTNGAEASAT